MIYDYRCNNCGHLSENVVRKMSERNNPLMCKKCGSNNSKLVITKPTELSDSWRMGIKKPDGDFRDFLSELARRNPGSNINDRK